MLSYGAISASQLGQCDGGRTIDSPRGTRQITTLRNDPISRPRSPHPATRSAVIGGDTTAGAGRGLRTTGQGHWSDQPVEGSNASAVQAPDSMPLVPGRPGLGLEHREAARRRSSATRGSRTTRPPAGRPAPRPHCGSASPRRRGRRRAAPARPAWIVARIRRRRVATARALTSRLRTSVCAARSFAPRRVPEKGRDRDGEEDADDRDHHQQLDQGEPACFRFGVSAMRMDLRERARGGSPRPGRSSSESRSAYQPSGFQPCPSRSTFAASQWSGPPHSLANSVPGPGRVVPQLEARPGRRQRREHDDVCARVARRTRPSDRSTDWPRRLRRTRGSAQNVKLGSTPAVRPASPYVVSSCRCRSSWRR